MRAFKAIRKNVPERGSQLVELAFMLPLLLVLIAGAADFAQAWNARQILTNAARDAARLGGSQSKLDLDTTSPNSIQDICQQVAEYLLQENINPSFMGVTVSATNGLSGCSSPGTIADPNGSVVPEGWTYYGSGTTYGLTIEPDIGVPPSGQTTCGSTAATACRDSTRVTLKYPYSWSFGFDRVIHLFGVTSSYASTIPIQVDATLPNL